MSQHILFEEAINKPWLLKLIALLLSYTGCTTIADTIPATPESGNVAKVLREAKPGDVIQLKAGEYREPISIPDGVWIEGDAETTTVVVDGPFAITLGTESRLSGVTIRKGKGGDIGAEVRGSARIERCRFVELRTGVRLALSPLTDVLACEFVDCVVGIETSHGCPTVWGNIFVGGATGIETDAEPFIKNNVFVQNWRGVSRGALLPRGSCHAVIRDNLFLECKGAGIFILMSDWAEDSPFITHNVFSQCRIAVNSEQRVLEGVRDCLVDSSRSSPFQNNKQEEFNRVGTQGIEEGNLKPSVANTTLRYELLAPIGKRRVGDGAPTVGPEPEWRIFGVHATAPLPPLRTMKSHPVVINSRAEQAQLAKQRRWRIKSGPVKLAGKTPTESMNFETPDGEEVELIFDLSRLSEFTTDR